MTAQVPLIAWFPNTATAVAAVVLGQNLAAVVMGKPNDFPDKWRCADCTGRSCGQPMAFWCAGRDAYIEGRRFNVRLGEIIAAPAGQPLFSDMAHRSDRVEPIIADPAIELRVIHKVRKRAAVVHSRPGRLYGRMSISVYRPSRVTKLGRRHHAYRRRVAGITARAYERGLVVDHDQLGLIGVFLGRDFSDTTERLMSGAPHRVRDNDRLRIAEATVVRREHAVTTELLPVGRWLDEPGTGRVRIGLLR